jgi:hypothetical protein
MLPSRWEAAPGPGIFEREKKKAKTLDIIIISLPNPALSGAVAGLASPKLDKV